MNGIRVGLVYFQGFFSNNLRTTLIGFMFNSANLTTKLIVFLINLTKILALYQTFGLISNQILGYEDWDHVRLAL